MSDIERMVDQVLSQASPRETEKMRNGCVDTAMWLTRHVLSSLTPTQVESVGIRIVEALAVPTVLAALEEATADHLEYDSLMAVAHVHELTKLSLDSGCGADCKEVIDSVSRLLASCPDSPLPVRAIWLAAVRQCVVLYTG